MRGDEAGRLSHDFSCAVRRGWSSPVARDDARLPLWSAAAQQGSALPARSPKRRGGKSAENKKLKDDFFFD
jgi:hypothetical protein